VGKVLCDFELLREEELLFLVAKQSRIDSELIVPRQPPEMASIVWCEEVVVRGNACLSDEETTPSDKLAGLTVHPDIEVLVGLGSCERDVHAFNDSTSL